VLGVSIAEGTLIAIRLGDLFTGNHEGRLPRHLLLLFYFLLLTVLVKGLLDALAIHVRNYFEHIARGQGNLVVVLARRPGALLFLLALPPSCIVCLLGLRRSDNCFFGFAQRG
jgi:hypothetical protein